MSSSRYVGKENYTFWPRTGILQHPSQRLYSNHYAILFVIFRALFFFSSTPQRSQEAHVESKRSFVVRQYLRGWAASCSSARSDLASSVPVPMWQILCNVHFGLPLQFLAMLVILFLVTAYVSSRMLFLMCWITVCWQGGLAHSLQLQDPCSHSWVYWWHCLQEGVPVLRIRSNTGINTVVSFSSTEISMCWICS